MQHTPGYVWSVALWGASHDDRLSTEVRAKLAADILRSHPVRRGESTFEIQAPALAGRDFVMEIWDPEITVHLVPPQIDAVDWPHDMGRPR